MALYELGPITQYSAYAAGVIPPDVYGVAINWYINRTPLFARLSKLPVGSPQFLITNDNYRPRSSALSSSLTDTSGTTVAVADGTIFDIDDEVSIGNEYMLVGSISGNNLTVTRGYAGTTAATHSTPVSVKLVTNTRTGGAVDINSMSRVPVAFTQWCQTVQHAYAVGGALQSDSNYTSGLGTPLDRDRMLATQHVVDDFEVACYKGKVVPLAGTTTRPQMAGLQSLITTNNTSSPTNAAAYKPSDLIRDALQTTIVSGGNPNVLLVSPDFQVGFATWGSPLMRLPAGENVFGTPIDLFEAPFLSGLTIVPAPLLDTGTVIALTDTEVKIRLKRTMFDKPRGSRGDANEGDIIMEGAIELNNEAHHAYVTGITGFAAA